jgi:hypothetical protein
MTDMSKWENGKTLTPEEEPEYLKDFCAFLREQQTLSEVRKEGDASVCDIVPDEIAAHAADIIEELWGRLQKEYWDGVSKGMEVKADQYAYEISKGVSKPE